MDKSPTVINDSLDLNTRNSVERVNYTCLSGRWNEDITEELASRDVGAVTRKTGSESVILVGIFGNIVICILL